MFYNILMKIWIGCSVLGAILLCMLIYIFTDSFPKANALLSKENIIFSILEDEPIYSEKNFDNRFKEYTLKIESRNNQPFINARVVYSSNVQVLAYTEHNTEIFYYFNVKEGTKISFELTTDNFEIGWATFNVIPFSNTLEISFTNLINKENQPYNLVSDNNFFLLYFVNDEIYYEDAIKNEYPCFLTYNAKVNNSLINGNNFTAFNQNITATTSNSSVLELNSETQTINVKKTGSASITFNYNYEDFQIIETIAFKVLNVPIETHNLPNYIEINMAENDLFALNYLIEPEYATDISYLLDDNAKKIINFNKNIITATAVGEGNINFLINSELHIINIKVINENFKKPDQDQEYTYEITLYEKEGLNYNSQTQTLTINLIDFNQDITVRFGIVLKDENETEIDPSFEIENNNEQLLNQCQFIKNNILFLYVEKTEGTMILTISHYELKDVKTQITIIIE